MKRFWPFSLIINFEKIPKNTSFEVGQFGLPKPKAPGGAGKLVWVFVGFLGCNVLVSAPPPMLSPLCASLALVKQMIFFSFGKFLSQCLKFGLISDASTRLPIRPSHSFSMNVFDATAPYPCMFSHNR